MNPTEEHIKKYRADAHRGGMCPDCQMMGFDCTCGDYVNLGEMCREIGMQCQYGSRYFTKNADKNYPFLGEGLRIKGSACDYHSMMIHKDDRQKAQERLFREINKIF